MPLIFTQRDRNFFLGGGNLTESKESSSWDTPAIPAPAKTWNL